jgi:hypothetical protein
VTVVLLGRPGEVIHDLNQQHRTTIQKDSIESPKKNPEHCHASNFRPSKGGIRIIAAHR